MGAHSGKPVQDKSRPLQIEKERGIFFLRKLSEVSRILKL